MEYKSTIKSRPYLYKKTKKAATLINQGLSLAEIKEKSLEENIFQLESEVRKKKVASIITSRLQGLGEYIIEKIVKGHVYKLINCISIIKGEFMRIILV